MPMSVILGDIIVVISFDSHSLPILFRDSLTQYLWTFSAHINLHESTVSYAWAYSLY